MKHGYIKVLRRRFIYVYLITILSIVTAANYNYASFVKYETQAHVQEIYDKQLSLDISSLKKTDTMQELTIFSILKSSILLNPIPIYIKINNEIYITEYSPHSAYYPFIVKPALVLSIILFALYFSVNRVLSTGMKRLVYLECFVEEYLTKDRVNENLYSKLELYDDEIRLMSRKMYELFKNDEQLTKQQKRFMKKLEELHEIILSFDENYKILESNKPWHELQKGEMLFTEYLSKTNLEKFQQNLFNLKNSLITNLILTDELLTKGSVYELKIIYTDGIFSAIIRDITVMYQSHQKVKFMSLHDGLTGLANRELFVDIFKTHMQKAKRDCETIAILFFDLNGFKSINDDHGHSIGDYVLKAFASRVTSALRESDTLARFGGDEFLAILPNLQDENIEHVVEKILDSLKNHLEIDGKIIELKASIGIASYPDDGIHVDELILKADKAMYASKKEGHSFCIYKRCHRLDK